MRDEEIAKYFAELKEVKLGEADFTAMQKEGELKVSKFTGERNPNDKYLSVVSEGDLAIEDNTKYKYLATYIQEKEQVVGIKLQRFKKGKKGILLPEPEEFSIPLKQASSLADFSKFLNEANLETLTSGNFKVIDEFELDPELYSKLVTLSSDQGGREALLKLIDEGYLELDLDIPDLIKKGFSVDSIQKRLTAIDSFEVLLEKDGLKEVADVQKELKKIPWIFGPEYSRLDVKAAGEEGLPDGRLKRIDGLSDILEVKLPSAKLLKQDPSKPARQTMYADLSNAIGQLTSYLEYYDSEYSTERDDDTGDEILEDTYGKYYKPKGILLIGRRDSAEPKRLRRLVSYFHRIEILTYDDLIERARNALTNLLDQKSE